MLASADLDVVRRDPAVPGLALVLDPAAVADLLRDRLGIVADRVDAVYVRYKPGTSCLVGYHLLVDGGIVRAHAKTFGGTPADKLAKRRQIESSSSWVVLDDPPLSLGLFPVDARLRALPMLTDEGTLRALVERLVPGASATSAACSLLAYKPERRFVGQLRLDGVPRAVIRAYTPLDWARARTAVDAFRSAAVRTPRRLGDWRRKGLLAVEWIEGVRLDEALRGEGGAQAVTRAGEALRTLHRHPAASLAHGGHEVDRRKLKAAAAAVSAILPELTSRVEAVVRRVGQRPARTAPVAVHGDFYARQVLVRPGGGVAILDLDEAEVGDPIADLATFVANLECDAIAGDLPRSHVEPLRRALLAGYGLGSAIDDTLNVPIAGMLLRLAPRFFRERDPRWPERSEAVIARASELVRGATVTTQPRPRVLADPATADALIALLDRALDVTRAAKAFATGAPAGVAGAGDLRAATLLRHRPPRRAVVAYEFDPAAPGGTPLVLLGKLRPQGADVRTYGVQRGLWEGGFSDNSADGISVAEPVAVVPRLRMWLQRRVSGTSATDLFLAGNATGLAARAARAIHKLHSSGLTPARVHGVREELEILRDRLGRVTALRPAWRKRLERVAKECERLGAEMADAPLAPIHRDFYPDHLLVGAERLYLIDFDLCSAGDPALDAGNFAAHLLELAVREPGSGSHLEESAAVFSHEFARLAGAAAGARADAYVTLTLARHVYISTQFADRELFTEQLLDLCEQRLARAQEVRLIAGC